MSGGDEAPSWDRVLIGWLIIPPVIALIIWITMFDKKWEVGLPMLALVPMWATFAGQLKIVSVKGKIAWKDFPGTCLFVMSLVVVLWSICFVDPYSVMSRPRVAGPIPTTCAEGGNLVQTVTSLNVARVLVDAPADIYTVASNCWDCKPRRIYSSSFPGSFFIDTTHNYDYMLVSTVNTNPVRYNNPTFNDQGVYEIDLTSFPSITIRVINEAWSYPVPIVVAVACLIFLQLLYVFGNRISDAYCKDDLSAWEATKKGLSFWVSENQVDDIQQEQESTQSKRIESLDIFRGISLVVMNIANYGGMGYWFLDHSKWDGLTVADLVFPWFIWIMGVAMAIALESRRIQADKGAAILHIIKRSSILILIGMLLSTSDGLSSFKNARIPGVLQRFGLSYLVVAITILLVPKNWLGVNREGYLPVAIQDGSATEAWLPKLAFGPSLVELPVYLIFMSVWLIVTFTVSFDHLGYHCDGYIGPGGISQQGAHFGCTGGAANYLDHKMFGDKHIYNSGCFPCDTYMDYDVKDNVCTSVRHHDPEGFLGSLNSIILCWLGVVAGRIVVTGKKTGNRRFVSFAMGALGCFLCLVAAVLCGFRQFGGPIPVNKNLWSTSFIFLMAGTGTLFLLVLQFIVDWKQYWSGKPFIFVGMNSILYYSMHEIMQNFVPFSAPSDAAPTRAAAVISVLLGVSTNVTVVYWLFRNKLFLKI
eukprot:TRINITY_DN3677_c1_g1_i3.p1 TRINITY_DN3677_c1_g1~~TRINITY_DN3677_c1_g1_i3.p1  ORF type:complete len:702 (+),score=98.41 TRINITY_DN3677_c1_g1_i3:68-2173(+)